MSHARDLADRGYEEADGNLMPADRVPLEDYEVAHDGFAEKPLLANSKAPQ